LLLQAETENRDDKRFARLCANAHFRYRASVEELSLDAARGIDRATVMELATGGYIRKGEAVLVTGATGCGKSFLVSALGHQACAQGHRVLYFNLQKLLLRIKMTRVDGSVYRGENEALKNGKNKKRRKRPTTRLKPRFQSKTAT